MKSSQCSYPRQATELLNTSWPCHRNLSLSKRNAEAISSNLTWRREVSPRLSLAAKPHSDPSPGPSPQGERAAKAHFYWLHTKTTAEGGGFAVLTCSSSGRPRQQRTPCQQWQSNSRRSAGLNPGWKQKQKEHCATKELLRQGNTMSQAGCSGRNFQWTGSSTENPRPPSPPLWLCSSLPALIQEVFGQGACHSLKRETKEQAGFPPSLPFSGKQTSPQFL